MSARHLALCAVVLVWLVAPSHAQAQIVNVQSQIKAVPEGFSGTVEGSVDWRTGSTRLLVLGGAARLNYRRGKDLVFAIARGDYGRVFQTDPSTLIIAKTFEHLRYRRTLTSRLLAETFVQSEADDFRRLSVRALAGAGPRVVLVESQAVSAYYGLAYMYEYERIANDGEADAGSRQHNSRLSTYLVAAVGLNDAVKASESFYVQPRVTELDDVRVLSELTLSSKLAKHLALETSFVLAYDSAPPETIDRFDSALKTAIAVSF